MFLFLIFKSPHSKPNINSFQLPAEKKRKGFLEHKWAWLSLYCRKREGGTVTVTHAIDKKVSYISPCIWRKMIRSWFRAWWTRAGGARRELKFYFCSRSNREIIWYPLEGSIRTRAKHNKGGIPCRQASTLAGGRWVNFLRQQYFPRVKPKNEEA